MSDDALTHYSKVLADARLDRVNRLRAAQGAPPLTPQQVAHDRSLTVPRLADVLDPRD